MRSARSLAIGMLALALVPAAAVAAPPAAPSPLVASLSADAALVTTLTARVLTLLAGGAVAPAESHALAVRADASRVELHWALPAGIPAPWVMRRAGHDEWTRVGRATVADGEAGYTDTAVAPGLVCVYALAGDTGARVGETRVEVPGLASLSVRGLKREPGAPAVVAFSLPEDAHARVAVIDAAGRTLWSRDYAPAAAGEQMLALDPAVRLAAGVYRVTLAQGPRLAMARVTLAD